ncbi:MULTISPECIES: transporter substrate-binding domain-containing protein [Vibrio]|jgi:cyclohexadienyl dehydratase|uniref:transporter substrate-binding domain-containing protein n=1 Tax=Vibrio TaxID=662 RepID=UPI0002FF3865|nr:MULTISPECIES: transporter substrate-binding domain-containing protein [Vibrio]MBB1465743.1 transporter substrate-binding domain-containing protein [Vibrio sp. SG41-7]MBE8565912.1 transporter substrate-binding domain-containing protein [Vibrio sp. OPT20]MCC4859566.1 transporter substrate-binding domain-containing protein [Vibrio splendidus]MDH5937241.1 transporter substrate-binding domain-containing protein [Vibrio splendidus]MDP2588784.1 transporter substrate-binding domain-containing prote
MKKSLIALGMCLLAFTQIAHAQSRLQEILEAGVLRVGTTGDWNPMTMKDPATNSYRGFDIDVTTELAKDLGVKVEYVATDWKTLVNGITANKYDVTGSASLNMSRAKVAGYSQPYFYLAFVPVVQKKDIEKFSDWSDFDKAEIKVAATLGTVQEKMVKDFFPLAQHIVIEAPARDFQELLARRADVSVTSNVEAATLVEKFKQLAIVPVKDPRKPTPIAMLLPQDDQVWINYINHWVELKKTQGFFKQTAEKWGLKSM